MMTYHTEIFNPEVISEINEHIKDHWVESGIDGIEPEADWDQYISLQDVGGAWLFTSRGENDELAGYAIYFTYLHPHYKGVMFATQDTIYVVPKYRGLGVANGLITYCDKFLSENLNTKIHSINVPLSHDYSRMLKGTGYEQVEKVMYKRVG